MPKLLQIGELAKQTGLSLRTLRYYDEIGLLVPPQHLLLSILQEGETGGGMAMRVLRECEVDSQKLKQQLQ